MRAFIVAMGLGLVASLFGNLSEARAQAGEAPAVINATVPADAQVWIDGTATTQTGTQRVFTSPPLATGKTYSYQVRVVSGDRDDTRKVVVQAGQRVAVNFTGAQVQETRNGGAAATPAPAASLPAASSSSRRQSFSSLSPMKKCPTGQ
jgi:uncharacterized protein (TIGR03000 family)